MRCILVSGDELLGFRAEGEVCEDDIALFTEEEAGEGEIDAFVGSARRRLETRRKAKDENREGRSVPEPAPVTMAVLPANERAIDCLRSAWN